MNRLLLEVESVAQLLEASVKVVMADDKDRVPGVAQRFSTAGVDLLLGRTLMDAAVEEDRKVEPLARVVEVCGRDRTTGGAARRELG